MRTVKKIDERPDHKVTEKTLLNSVGIKIRKTMSGIKFVYRQEIIDELEQLGFSINVLKVKGGEVPLPVLRKHVDEQATLEAYWSANAENARYLLSVAQDKYNYWYEAKYAICFNQLRDKGIPKPTAIEVNARISLKFKTDMQTKKARIRILERNYRLLHNACYTSILTKGRMLQTLRNVIQGGTFKMASVDSEIIGSDITKLRVGD